MVVTLPPFAGDHHCPVPALGAGGRDVRVGGFGGASPVEGQLRDQRVLSRLPRSCGRWILPARRGSFPVPAPPSAPARS